MQRWAEVVRPIRIWHPKPMHAGPRARRPKPPRQTRRSRRPDSQVHTAGVGRGGRVRGGHDPAAYGAGSTPCHRRVLTGGRAGRRPRATASLWPADSSRTPTSKRCWRRSASGAEGWSWQSIGDHRNERGWLRRNCTPCRKRTCTRPTAELHDSDLPTASTATPASCGASESQTTPTARPTQNDSADNDPACALASRLGAIVCSAENRPLDFAVSPVADSRQASPHAVGVVGLIRRVPDKPPLPGSVSGYESLVGVLCAKQPEAWIQATWADLLRDLDVVDAAAGRGGGQRGAGLLGGAAGCVARPREQRDCVHKVADALDALPKSVQPTAKKMLAEIRDAEDRDHAAAAATGPTPSSGRSSRKPPTRSRDLDRAVDVLRLPRRALAALEDLEPDRADLLPPSDCAPR